MTLDQYIESISSRRIAVVGVGVSNIPLIERLAQSGCDVTACDARGADALGDVYERLSAYGVKFRLGDDYLSLLDYDLIFRTPGLHPDKLKAHVRPDAVVSSEMEVFFALCPCRIIAVTGSDGKTTTTTLVSELLKAEGYTVHLGGNIGRPLLCDLPQIGEEDFAVLELSSFQLHSMNCRPNVAVVTNLSPNHLDVHPDLKDYENAKKSIFMNQQAGDRLVLNYDNSCAKAFAEEAVGDVVWFSRISRPEKGFYALNGAIYHDGEKLMDTADIRLPGEHNVENMMAAFAAVDGLVSEDNCRKVAMEFGGVEHRLELVRTLRGVRYYNDSIASSPTRAVAGLRSFDQKVILLAGGHDKHVPFDEFARQALISVKALFLCGETAGIIKDAVESAEGYNADELPIYVYDQWKDTILAASEMAQEGDIVLLSPACSSFDKFRNFVERGLTFKRIVEEID